MAHAPSLKKYAALFVALVCAFVAAGPTFAAPVRYRVAGTPAPTPMPAVIPVTVIPLARAASILRGLYPSARISEDRSSNSLIVFATPDQIQAMRNVIQGVDVKNPTVPTVEIIALHVVKPRSVVARLREIFPNAQISAASAASLFVKANPLDMAQIHALVSTLDTPAVTTTASSPPAEAVRITQINPRSAARAIAHQLPHLRASVSGSSIILVGSQEDITRAKALVLAIDQPAFGSRYTQIYRLKNIDATSVGDLVSRSYPSARVTVDKELNALSVLATAAQHQRIADAISQLDGAPGTNGSGAEYAGGGGAAYGNGNVEVVELKSAIPGQGQGQMSTTATEIGTAVTGALQQLAPDLHVVPVQNTNTLILSGSPQSIRMAKALIDRLDHVPPLVVLDTEILELDESVARNLGISFPQGQAQISSTFQEVLPATLPNGNPGRLISLQPLQRTGLQFTAVLNLLIQKGNARVLADPRITTISGRTATIRAGDTIGILTQSGGGVGTPVTQQLQQFNTGVTLDITPIVNEDHGITVALHPVVNSISATQLGSVPTISTRDTQTIVHLLDNETLVIGGLIQEATSKASSKIPILGDIPLIGRIFRSDDVTYVRNELIMVVTPHVIVPGSTLAPPPTAALPAIPTPMPLPTLPPHTQLPSTQAPRVVLTPEPTQNTPPPAPGPTGATFHAPAASPTPVPARTPSAFASANVFEYGQAPQNAYAGDSDAPQIFYASFSPTILRQGTPVNVSVITTTNVRRVTVGISGYLTPLVRIAPSKWQASYSFSTSGIPVSQSTVNLTLTAYRSDGAATSIQVPVSFLNNNSDNL